MRQSTVCCMCEYPLAEGGGCSFCGWQLEDGVPAEADDGMVFDFESSEASAGGAEATEPVLGEAIEAAPAASAQQVAAAEPVRSEPVILPSGGAPVQPTSVHSAPRVGPSAEESGKPDADGVQGAKFAPERLETDEGELDFEEIRIEDSSSGVRWISADSEVDGDLELTPDSPSDHSLAMAEQAAAGLPTAQPAVSEIVCPNCRYRQEGGAECRNCGLIFSRVFPEGPAAAKVAPPPWQRAGQQSLCPSCGVPRTGGLECTSCGVVYHRVHLAEEPEAGWRVGLSTLWQWFRVFRWISLALLVCTLFLVLRRSDPPPLSVDSGAGERVEQKLEQTRQALRSGQPHTLRLDTAEVNSWLGRNLSIADNVRPDVEEMIGREASLDEVQAAVHNVQIDLLDDQVLAYLVFDFHGKALSLLVQGQLRTENGFLRLDVTSGKLGSLPIPRAAMERAVGGVFNAPQNREIFRLPQHVRSVSVQHGQLVVEYR